MNQPLSATCSLEETARPLLALVQRLTELETTFITTIDWDVQVQIVLFALNTSALVIAEGSQVAWKDSMCRTLLGGKEFSSDVSADLESNIAAEKLGLKSFLV